MQPETAALGRIAMMIAEDLASDAPKRRKSADTYDLERAILESAFSKKGLALSEVVWARAGEEAWTGIDGVLVLAAWDYQDRAQDFLDLVARLELRGIPVWNASPTIKWNIRKTYLRDLAALGVPVIPTLWPEHPTDVDILAAFETFNVDDVVLKRQVGAGAHGQRRIRRSDALEAGPVLDRPGMIQPFLRGVAEEGEFSFLFLEGDLSHVTLKRAVAGDYRIQPTYGGTSQAVAPTAEDLSAARTVLRALTQVSPSLADPLYARVDMARGPDGGLLLMELELIEPYLFPEDGREIGPMLAAAVARRLG